MANTFNALTTGTGGVATSGDSSGTFAFASNGTTVATISATGVINATSITGLTTALTAAQGGTGLTSPGTSGNVLTSNGTAWTSAAAPSAGLRMRGFAQGTTYTPAADVKSFYALVYGATGGISTGSPKAGVGGCGYSEKYYATPAASYTYSIGARGASTGTAGGTTTFDVMTVTGSGGVTGTTGSSGGVGSGGDFNATGGTGGNSNGVANANGGGGGAGSRAGNGGNGSASTGLNTSSGGGTGGNNASGTTPGAGATAKAAGALTLPKVSVEIFQQGSSPSTNGGFTGAGAIPATDNGQYNSQLFTYGIAPITSSASTSYANYITANSTFAIGGNQQNYPGSFGLVFIIEVL